MVNWNLYLNSSAGCKTDRHEMRDLYFPWAGNRFIVFCGFSCFVCLATSENNYTIGIYNVNDFTYSDNKEFFSAIICNLLFFIFLRVLTGFLWIYDCLSNSSTTVYCLCLEWFISSRIKNSSNHFIQELNIF